VPARRPRLHALPGGLADLTAGRRSNTNAKRADVEATVRDITGSLVTHHLVEPRWIEKVSYFGAQEGHIHTDSSGVL